MAYDIVALPVEAAVTTPDVLTVAIAVLLLLQPPPEDVEESVLVVPVQIVDVPLMVPAAGSGLTVTDLVVEAEPQVNDTA